jgi:hypothetical protein
MITPLESRLDRLTAEVQDLRHDLRQALQLLPKTDDDNPWMTSSELAKEVGLTSRTLAQWATDGRFPDEVVQKAPRGNGFRYLFRRDNAKQAVYAIRANG